MPQFIKHLHSLTVDGCVFRTRLTHQSETGTIGFNITWTNRRSKNYKECEKKILVGVDEQKTMRLFGYYSHDLKPKSGEMVVVVCKRCGEDRIIKKCDYRDSCRSCAHIGIIFTDEHCNNLSKAGMGKTRSPEHCKNLSNAQKDRKVKPFTDIHRQRLSDAGYNRAPITDETRRRQSATRQGIPYDEWESFAKDQRYCPNFNEACRESNREKYDRRCFLSGVTEEDNGQKLSVHHYDMNKAQGCDGHAWKLVPLCRNLHNASHTSIWTARIVYLLEHVWSCP